MPTPIPIEVQRLTCARIPTDFGIFELCLYANNRDDKEHLAVVMGDVVGQDQVLVRVHSECFTGDVLGSRRCDCGEQLLGAMQCISEAQKGVIIYLRQEGRGIGLLNKLRAYNLQDEGYDTVEANIMLGHQADERDYGLAAAIMQDLQIASIRLMTNNPTKVASLIELGIQVDERVSLETTIYPENAFYLATKAQRMNHQLNLKQPPVEPPQESREPA